MVKKSPAYVIAACFALSAFAVAIFAGLTHENAASVVLWRAILAMILCYPVGLLVGVTCQRVIDEHVRLHQNANPVPDSMNLAQHDDSLVDAVPVDGEEVITV